MAIRLLIQNMRWTCHHAHLDKSLLITPELLEQSNQHMQEKWYLMRELKKDYTEKKLYSRMKKTVDMIASQGCKYIRTFVDVDNIVGLKCVEQAHRLKSVKKQDAVYIQLATQPLEGLAGDDANIELFEKAANICDIVGCLPSRDGKIGKWDEHLDIAFSTAKRLNKPLEAHLDQLNTPNENETERFCDFVEKYNYQGKARSIHSISVACQPLDKQKEITERLRELDIGVVICPSAAISMTQETNIDAPIHNSIAPVKMFIDNGVNVALGIDNIQDLFMPFCDGNLEFELRLLAEATRIYDKQILEMIAENKMGFEERI